MSTMKIRTKGEITKAMTAQGIINDKGNFTGKTPKVTVKPMSITQTPKGKLKKVTGVTSARVRKTSSAPKAPKITKLILFLEKINDFATKEKMFDNMMAGYFGDRYNPEMGYVAFAGGANGKKIRVSVTVQEMKIRSSATSNTSGIRVYVVKNENKYSVGEYAGKLSVSVIIKRIEKYAAIEVVKVTESK